MDAIEDNGVLTPERTISLYNDDVLKDASFRQVVSNGLNDSLEEDCSLESGFLNLTDSFGAKTSQSFPNAIQEANSLHESNGLCQHISSSLPRSNSSLQMNSSTEVGDGIPVLNGSPNNALQEVVDTEEANRNTKKEAAMCETTPVKESSISVATDTQQCSPVVPEPCGETITIIKPAGPKIAPTFGKKKSAKPFKKQDETHTTASKNIYSTSRPSSSSLDPVGSGMAVSTSPGGGENRKSPSETELGHSKPASIDDKSKRQQADVKITKVNEEKKKEQEQKKLDREQKKKEQEQKKLEREQKKKEQEQKKLEREQKKKEQEQKKLDREQKKKEQEQKKLEREQKKKEQEQKKLEREQTKKEQEQKKFEREQKKKEQEHKKFELEQDLVQEQLQELHDEENIKQSWGQAQQGDGNGHVNLDVEHDTDHETDDVGGPVEKEDDGKSDHDSTNVQLMEATQDTTGHEIEDEENGVQGFTEEKDSKTDCGTDTVCAHNGSKVDNNVDEEESNLATPHEKQEPSQPKEFDSTMDFSSTTCANVADGEEKKSVDSHTGKVPSNGCPATTQSTSIVPQVKGPTADKSKKTETDHERADKKKTAITFSKPGKKHGVQTSKLQDKAGSGTGKTVEREKVKPKKSCLRGPVWVQCEECGKWRILDDCKDPSLVPSNWTCSMNTDSSISSCMASEDQWPNLTNSQEYIYSQYMEGSVVWAKLQGYPWWPGMIEDDPDMDACMSWNEDNPPEDTPPAEYHIVYFGRPVSRAWVPSSMVQTFDEDGKPPEKENLGAYAKSLTLAVREAKEALNETIEVRLDKYAFQKRFNKSARRRKSTKRREMCSIEDDEVMPAKKKRGLKKDD